MQIGEYTWTLMSNANHKDKGQPTQTILSIEQIDMLQQAPLCKITLMYQQ